MLKSRPSDGAVQVSRRRECLVITVVDSVDVGAGRFDEYGGRAGGSRFLF